MKIKAPIRRRLNNALRDLCLKRHHAIPLDEIRTILENEKVEMEGEFMLLGREGRTTLELQLEEVPVEHVLVLSWHKDTSQTTYEINSYVS